jgi:uncharacterized membrane protein
VISDAFSLLTFLMTVVGALFWLKSLRAFERVFHYVPPVLWILLVPTLATTFRLIPSEHLVYDWLQNRVLIVALVLLLLATNLRSIARIGRPALWMMVTASASLAVGAVIAFAILHTWLPADAWKSIAALMGVWTGGYGNMVAVATSVDASAAMLTNAIITDTVVGFAWMSLLITLAPAQEWLDRRLRADRAVLDDLNDRLARLQAEQARSIGIADLAVMLGLGIGVAWLAGQAGGYLPTANGVFSPFTWSVILASAAGVLLSLSPFGMLQHAGATQVGTYLLYLAYAAIGARANLNGIGSAPMFLLVGAVIVVFHAIVMLVVARAFRIPIFAVVVASQANIGGMATAPIVASIYQRALAGVAVLLVPLGLAYGTFVALLVAAVCRMLD